MANVNEGMAEAEATVENSVLGWEKAKDVRLKAIASAGFLSVGGKVEPSLVECQAGALVIDVLSPLEDYLEKLQPCEIILSSSLHGIIFAHAYDKPALWIELSDQVIGNGFKFFDYYLSIGISPEDVTRLRISEDVNPYEAAKLATVGDHTELLLSLEAAIDKTRGQLQEVC